MARRSSPFRHAWDAAWSVRRAGHVLEAIALFRTLVREYPQKALAHFGLATSLWEAERLGPAERSVRRSLRLQESSLARELLAVIVLRQKGFAEAQRIWLTGIRRAPGSFLMWQRYSLFLKDHLRPNESREASLIARRLKRRSGV
jgi:tetratricopeptide (TPR) repeat protein